jgi:hypothetical protein
MQLPLWQHALLPDLTSFIRQNQFHHIRRNGRRQETPIAEVLRAMDQTIGAAEYGRHSLNVARGFYRRVLVPVPWAEGMRVPTRSPVDGQVYQPWLVSDEDDVTRPREFLNEIFDAEGWCWIIEDLDGRLLWSSGGQWVDALPKGTLTQDLWHRHEAIESVDKRRQFYDDTPRCLRYPDVDRFSQERLARFPKARAWLFEEIGRTGYETLSGDPEELADAGKLLSCEAFAALALWVHAWQVTTERMQRELERRIPMP